MARICLIRHGETDWNKEKRIQGRSDVPLNEEGISQVREVHDGIWKTKWDMIYSSPLQRATKTAAIINEQYEIPLEIEEAFIEKSFGEVEGLAYDYVFSTYPDEIYPKAETDEEVVKRVLDGLSVIAERHKDEDVLIVTHGAIIHALLAHFDVIPSGLKHIILHHLCMNKFILVDGEWKVESYNTLPME